MRPHRHDREHNLTVGRAFRTFVGDLIVEGYAPHEIDHSIGEHVNAVAQAGYDLGAREALVPSQN